MIKDNVRTLALRCNDLEQDSLPKKIAHVLQTDESLARILMPAGLGLSPDAKPRIGIPPEDLLWENLLAIVVKCLSGLLTDGAYCQSLSNESNFRMAQIFDDPLKELSNHAATLRALCIGDVHSSHMIRNVIDTALSRKFNPSEA
ncbi:MAG: hypothetical protein LR015_06145 [Verrucomicrobia bacterium]|nr:hypothetical protein [Verrucomicrobiota bacterium]